MQIIIAKWPFMVFISDNKISDVYMSRKMTKECFNGLPSIYFNINWTCSVHSLLHHSFQPCRHK